TRPAIRLAVTAMTMTSAALVKLSESDVSMDVAIRAPGVVGTVILSPAVGMLNLRHSAYLAGLHNSTLDPAGIVLVTPLTGVCATVSVCGELAPDAAVTRNLTPETTMSSG